MGRGLFFLGNSEQTTNSVTSHREAVTDKRVSEGCPRPPGRNMRLICGLNLGALRWCTVRGKERGKMKATPGLRGSLLLDPSPWRGGGGLLVLLCVIDLSPQNWLACAHQLANSTDSPLFTSPPPPRTFYSPYNSCVFCFQSALLAFKSSQGRFVDKRTETGLSAVLLVCMWKSARADAGCTQAGS